LPRPRRRRPAPAPKPEPDLTGCLTSMGVLLAALFLAPITALLVIFTGGGRRK
jgi:hypothetical protein